MEFDEINVWSKQYHNFKRNGSDQTQPTKLCWLLSIPKNQSSATDHFKDHFSFQTLNTSFPGSTNSLFFLGHKLIVFFFLKNNLFSLKFLVKFVK